MLTVNKMHKYALKLQLQASARRIYVKNAQTFVG